MSMRRIAAVLLGGLMLMLGVTTAHAAYVGTVTKAECVSIRQHMTKSYVEGTLWEATGILTHDFTRNGNWYKTYSYRASKSWDRTKSGAGVEYYFESPTGQWRVSEATCIYIKPLQA